MGFVIIGVIIGVFAIIWLYYVIKCTIFDTNRFMRNYINTKSVDNKEYVEKDLFGKKFRFYLIKDEEYFIKGITYSHGFKIAPGFWDEKNKKEKDVTDIVGKVKIGRVQAKRIKLLNKEKKFLRYGIEDENGYFHVYYEDRYWSRSLLRKKKFE